MSVSRISVASIAVVLSGIVWGFYWVPVRWLERAGMTGAWGTVAITLAGCVALAPLMLRFRDGLARADRVGLAAIAFGGAGFALYSIALIYGRVTIVVLLFFLTPVWSTLIARYLLGWKTPVLRLVAIFAGLAGLGVMLGASGDWPIPRRLGEWLGLISGMMWAVGSTGMKMRADVSPLPSAFMFVCGAALMSCAVVPFLPGTPVVSGPVFLIAAGTGVIWWGASIAALMWATRQLDPARVGILLMSEVIVAALSAALLAGEHLSTREIIGGALVVGAGMLEVWPVRRARH